MKRWLLITLLIILLLCGGWVVELMWSAGQFKTIEKFLLQDDQLVHQKTVADPALVSPNDLAAVGPEQFYVTNDHRYQGGFKRFVEEIYLDTGAEISGSSVAAVRGNRILIGSVFDPKFLDCQLD